MLNLGPGDLGFLALLCGLGVERLFELWLSKRNAEKQLQGGAKEFGRGHYGPMAAFHTLFLIACAAELFVFRPHWPLALEVAALALALAAQGLRYWAVASLGERWNTRVIVRPEALPITRGPYRYVRHPNYAAVMLELFSVPLVHGCWRTALAFTLGNAIMLAVRIPVEERALGGAYREAFAALPRFVPWHRAWVSVWPRAARGGHG